MAATATATTTTPTTTAATAPTNPMDRRPRLSVSNANALANFAQLQERFQNHRLVVFLDYDGTLTPIVSDPMRALLTTEMRETLEQLRTKFTAGVISGRSLDKIQRFVGIPQLYYAGSHGFDIAGPNGTAIKNQVASEFLADLQQVRDALASRVGGMDKAEVEDNVFSVSLHYRCVGRSRLRNYGLG